jgi:hypothetical protein
MTIDNLYNKFLNWLDYNSNKKYYSTKLVILLVFLSLFFATPKFLYYNYEADDIVTVWNAYKYKSTHLTSSLTQYDPTTHEAKLVFRLSIPILIKFLGLNFISIYIFKFILGILSLLLTYKITDNIVKDKVSSTFVTAGLAFIYFGRSGFVVFPTFDELAYFSVLLALYYPKPWLIFICCTISAWTDERSFIALPIVLIYYQILEPLKSDNPNIIFNLKNILKPNKSSIAAISAIVFYTFLRLLLSYQYEMHLPPTISYFYYLKVNIPDLGFGIWSFLEGFWILVFLALVVLLWQKSYFLILIISAQLIVSAVIACSVGDITRSGSCIVPMIFVFLLIIKNNIGNQLLRNVLFLCFFVCFVFPSHYIVGDLVMEEPLYYEILHFILKRLL